MHLEETIVANTIQFVKKKLQGEASGHDWWHIYRVWKMAMHIGLREGANKYVVQLAALLHDLADWKLWNGNEEKGLSEIKTWLIAQNTPEKTIKHVMLIISNISFKGANVPNRMRTIEGKVVQDADRLDAIGAIGVARAFAYGGNKGREMHNPDIQPVIHNTFDEYKSSNGTTINHFYEKLLLLKEQMNTPTAKKIAAERHKFLETFLKQFLNEWNGAKM